MTDFQEVTSSLGSWSDWCAAWSDRAAIHEELAREALDSGHARTAGDAYTRAALCYHFGRFLFVEDLEQARTAGDNAVRCRTAALPLLDPPGRRIAIPYREGSLYGNLRLPPGADVSPVVIMCMGLDSAKEEMHDYEQRFLDRGVATFAFDGPGQSEGSYDFVIEPAYEQVVSAVVDVVEELPGVDPGRIAVWGVSMGGYYSARAAAFEHRLVACMSLSGAYERITNFDVRPGLNREAFRVRSGSPDQESARRVAERMSLRGIARQITCPTYILAGTKDRLTPPSDAQRLASEVAGPVTLAMIEGGNHVANNLWYRYRDQSADWLADVLRP